MKERTRHRLAFDFYVRMGAHRSLEALHRALQENPSVIGLSRAPSRSTLEAWSGAFRWQDRLLDLERQAAEQDRQEQLKALWEMSERHAKEGLLQQQKGAEWLVGMAGKQATADAAIRALVEGARLERLARGEPTERQEVRSDVEINTRLAALTDEELDRLIEYAEGALGGQGPARPS